MTPIQLRFAFFITAILLSFSGQAQDLYVTDQFEVTMRSGTSTSNNIISMLKSGQKVELLEEDIATKYSLVQLENGKQGYVLSRFLDRQPSGRERYNKLKIRSEQLNQTIAELREEVQNYQSSQQSDGQMITQLKTNLAQSQRELKELTAATSDTIRIIEQNENLQTRINVLESEKKLLSEENAQYKDSTAMDWFIRGAGVSLTAFLIGIIVTRIRWKKRDSWGSY